MNDEMKFDDMYIIIILNLEMQWWLGRILSTGVSRNFFDQHTLAQPASSLGQGN